MPTDTIGAVQNAFTRTFDHYNALQEKPDNAALAKKLQRSVASLVNGLDQLDNEERKKLDLTEEDKKQIALLAGAGYLAKDDKTTAIFRDILGKADPHFLAAFADNRGAQRPDAAGKVGGHMGLQAVFDRVKAEGGRARKLTDADKGKRKEHAGFQMWTGLVKEAADTKFVDSKVETFEAGIKQLKGMLKAPGLGDEDKAAIKARIEGLRGSIVQLKGVKGSIGLESAGVADDPLFEEMMAHGFGLPSTLSKKQIAKYDELAGGNGSEPRFGLLAAAVGGSTGPLAGLLAASKANDRAGLEAAVAALTPESPQLSPTQNASADANLEALRTTNPQAYETLSSFRAAQAEDDMKSRQTFSEIMGLLNSGMPIEVIILLVMLKLTERQEDKFKLKLKELATFEKIESINKKVSEDFEKQVADVRTQGAADAQAAGKAAGKELTDEQLAKAGQQAVARAEPALQAEADKRRINPTDYGLKSKSTTILMQEMQAQQQIFMQVMQALSAVMRQVQDLVMTPIRNIR
ncbi:MAG: hypothetical protein V3T05_04210 [Myxococcota bacterium]